MILFVENDLINFESVIDRFASIRTSSQAVLISLLYRNVLVLNIIVK